MKTLKRPPIITIVGLSGAGKTTLLEKLIAELTRCGLRVGTIKHDVHGFEMDLPGKDSWRHKQAGAKVTVISSPGRIGMVKDVDHDHTLEEIMPLLGDVDLILAEGYKRADQPKLEVFRADVHDGPLCRGDRNLIALISEAALDLGVPRFSPQDVTALAEVLRRHFHLPPDGTV